MGVAVGAGVGVGVGDGDGLGVGDGVAWAVALAADGDAAATAIDGRPVMPATPPACVEPIHADRPMTATLSRPARATPTDERLDRRGEGVIKARA